MKKKLCCTLCAIMLLCSITTGCGSSKVIDGKEYETYGFINADEEKNDKIKYKTIVGNVVLGIIFCETIVAPVYFFGFSIKEPVGLKDEKGTN